MVRLLCLLPLLLIAAIGTARAQDPGQLCRAGIAAAERAAGIPPQLLHAIAHVESGRRDPASGAVVPWPWTINAEGQGKFFPSKEEAIAAVRQLQARGVRLIDVGCMQINLYHHADAFASLEQAFDPASNARYAARFLSQLHDTRGDWALATGNYHSGTPERAEAYRAAVMAAWPAEQRLAASNPPGVLPVMARLPGLAGGGGFAGMGVGTGGFGMSALSTGGRVIPMANAMANGVAAGMVSGMPGGLAGRGLAAYRAAPIAVAARAAPMLPDMLRR